MNYVIIAKERKKNKNKMLSHSNMYDFIIGEM